MEKNEIKTWLKDIPKDINFFMILLFFNSLTGFITLTTIFQSSIFTLIKNNVVIFLYMAILLICWLFVEISLLFNKTPQMDLKDLLKMLLIMPIYVFSLIGQLGNSEAILILFGEGINQIYLMLFVILYFYILYLLQKDICNRQKNN